MLLAVDVGNTNIVIGACNSSYDLVFKACIATSKEKTFEQYAVEIKNILELFNVDKGLIEGSIISSVALPLTSAIRKAVELVTSTKPLIIGPGIKTGLNIKIDNPAQLGSDLVVGAVAALDEYRPPLIIFDLGTATTASVIDEHKNFLGGTIFPGVNISLEALSSRTSQLPHIGISDPGDIIGKNTVDSMKSGIIYGSAAMIDGMVAMIEEEIGAKAQIIATGGLAEMIIPYCKSDIHIDSDLMLKGLCLVYEKNLR